MLVCLKTIYLMVHALNWLEITPEDPRRLTPTWEQWPGRCEICHRYEFTLRDRYYGLMSTPNQEAAVFVLPSGMKGDPPLIELAQKTFGERCVVCRDGSDPSYSRALLGEDFARSLADDRRRAETMRGGSLTDGGIGAWERSREWAEDLRRQLESRGYTFDLQTVDVIAFGEDWCGCAGTYPIHMGRAWGLANPIRRQFELINPDCSPLLLRCTVVEQGLAMPHDVRLFIFRTDTGELVAQYWDGLHGLYDLSHVARVHFPPGSARPVDLRGNPRGDRIGGALRLKVGCGGHTPHPSELVRAEAGLSLDEFRRALLVAEVTDLTD